MFSPMELTFIPTGISIRVEHRSRSKICHVGRKSLSIAARKPRSSNFRWSLRKVVYARVSEDIKEEKENKDGSNPSLELSTNKSVPLWKKIRIPILLAYIGFVLYGFFLGPGSNASSDVLRKTLAGSYDEINDLFFAIFNLMGALGLVYASILNPGAAQQSKLPTGIFSFLGMFLGFIGIGPYVIARDYVPSVTKEQVEKKGVISKVLESRIFGLFPLIYSLWAYSFAFGIFTPGTESWHDVVFYSAAVDLWRLCKSDRFVSSTTIDFITLSSLLWGPLTEDMKRRGWFIKGREGDSILTALSILMVPVIGPALYLVVRPRLPEKSKSE